MNDRQIDVIATTISGSISDWGKVKHIVPLFSKHGYERVSLFVVQSHAEARTKARECIQRGTRIIISAGGSGTFNSVLEGCCDSGINLHDVMLGFLRKGSADLIGKTLGMPDEIEDAIRVFAESISANRTVPCDILVAESERGSEPPHHFVGYGGAEIFGDIPSYTENRFVKYYKGVLGQLFGDLGPFFVGASLSSLAKVSRSILTGKRRWEIVVDRTKVSEGFYQAFIIVNGDLGKDLPLARSAPLGSGEFHLFALRDLGLGKLPGQFKHTWDASVSEDPARWGFETYRIRDSLQLKPDGSSAFNMNTDGFTMKCTGSVRCHISGQIGLITRV